MVSLAAARPDGIVFFDIDGTLVTGTSSGSFLAQRLGHRREVDEAEARYAAGAIDNHEVCAIDARGWAGTSVTQVSEWLDNLPLIDGIDEAVAWCKSQNLIPVLASLAWDPVGAHLAQRFSFSAHCGPKLRVSSGRYTGEVAMTFDEHDKRRFALSICSQLGVPPSRCVAIGDSRSDIPLFDAVGFSVAFNASQDARATATTAVDSSSLLDALPPIDSWLLQTVVEHTPPACTECGFDHAPDLARLTARCNSFPEAVGQLLSATTRECIRRRRAPHVWSALEYAAHVSEAVRWYTQRVRRVLDEELPHLMPYDFDGAAESGEYNSREIGQVVDELRSVCNALANLAESLDSSQLRRRGRGSDGTPRTVTALLSRAEHELSHHELDIRRSLSATGDRDGVPDTYVRFSETNGTAPSRSI